jgi:hypothetical protein
MDSKPKYDMMHIKFNVSCFTKKKQQENVYNYQFKHEIKINYKHN